MNKPNKPYDTSPPVMLVKIRLRLSSLYHLFARFCSLFCWTNVVLFKGHSMEKLYGLLAIDTLLLTKGGQMASYLNLFNLFGYHLRVVEQ